MSNIDQRLSSQQGTLTWFQSRLYRPTGLGYGLPELSNLMNAGAHQAVAITFTCDESHHMAAEALRALESDNMMQNIEVRVDEAISASTILSEGVVQRWFIADGALAETGAKIAEVRVEDALHEITSPASGRLTIIAAVNDVVEPRFLLATLAVASIDTHAGY